MSDESATFEVAERERAGVTVLKRTVMIVTVGLLIKSELPMMHARTL